MSKDDKKPDARKARQGNRLELKQGFRTNARNKSKPTLKHLNDRLESAKKDLKMYEEWVKNDETSTDRIFTDYGKRGVRETKKRIEKIKLQMDELKS